MLGRAAEKAEHPDDMLRANCVGVTALERLLGGSDPDRPRADLRALS